MSTSFNKVTLVGRLGKDAESKQIGDNTKVVFSLATDSYRGKDDDDEPQYATQWHFISLFGKLGEAIKKYMTKGKLVLVEGELNYWQDDDSNWHTEIKAYDIKLLSLKGDEVNEDSNRQSEEKTKNKTNSPTKSGNNKKK